MSDYLPGLVPAADVEPLTYRVPTNMVGQDTSREATIHFTGRVGRQRKRVFDVIRASGLWGMTCWEVENELAMLHSSASGRIYELHGGYRKFPWQFIRNSGRRRKTGSESNAIVWVALDVVVPVTWELGDNGKWHRVTPLVCAFGSPWPCGPCAECLAETARVTTGD